MAPLRLHARPRCLNNRAFPRLSWTTVRGAAHFSLHVCRVVRERTDVSPNAGVPRMSTPVTARQSSTLAVVSLVAGILGWSMLPVIGSVVAIVTGHLARAEIRRRPEALEGDGLAIAGLVLGYAIVALAIIGVLCMLLFFGGMFAFIAATS